MESKTCIFVGNGKFNKSYGSLIDSYDNVYRFNRFVTKKYEEFVGTKCTHWILNNALTVDCRDFFRKNIDGHLKLYPTLEKVLVLTNSSDKISDLKEIKKNYKIFDYHISNFKPSEHKPSTGLLAINHFLNQYDEIHLIGFDFGNSNHYWVSKKVSESDKPGKGHHWKKEEKYVMNLVAVGKIKIIETNT
jgi:hypothetical protein